MFTDAVNHAPAQILMNTGSQQFGRPSFGSWTLYGLGCATENLPGYVVLASAKGTSGGASNYGSGFLPTSFGGVPFRGSGDPLLYLSNPPGFDVKAQRESLDVLRQLNESGFDRHGDPETQARIHAYKSAFYLQRQPGEHPGEIKLACWSEQRAMKDLSNQPTLPDQIRARVRKNQRRFAKI